MFEVCGFEDGELATIKSMEAMGLFPTLLTSTTMIKKRSRPQPRIREISPEVEEASNSDAGETGAEERLE